MLKYSDSNVLRFRMACKEVRSLQKLPKNEELLRLYGLYKQVTLGDNTTSRPWFSMKERAKWNSWKFYEGTDKESARASYIDLVNTLTKRIGVTQWISCSIKVYHFDNVLYKFRLWDLKHRTKQTKQYYNDGYYYKRNVHFVKSYGIREFIYILFLNTLPVFRILL